MRTPLTSLALYLDLIHMGKYKNQEELNTYLEKGRRKVAQIKQMTDQLFERFYLEKGNEKSLENPEYVKEIFDDLLSNTASYIAENGFKIETNIVWPSEKASVSLDYVTRILDNISSNILKYADENFPVIIEVNKNDGKFRIQFCNHIKHLDKKPYSTEVGLENIKFMMDKMGGECEILDNQTVYMIRLNFKLDITFEI